MEIQKSSSGINNSLIFRMRTSRSIFQICLWIFSEFFRNPMFLHFSWNFWAFFDHFRKLLKFFSSKTPTVFSRMANMNYGNFSTFRKFSPGINNAQVEICGPEFLGNFSESQFFSAFQCLMKFSIIFWSFSKITQRNFLQISIHRSYFRLHFFETSYHYSRNVQYRVL